MRFQFQAGAPAPLAAAAPCEPATCTPTSTAAAPRRSAPGSLRGGAVVVAASLALAGCASSVRLQQALPWKVEPVLDVKHGEHSSKAYYALGRYHDGSQAWDKANDAYRKAIAADARNAEAHNALGVLLARWNRLADAETALRQAVALAPQSAHIRSNLGLVLLGAGRSQEAVGELQASLGIDPDNSVAKANLREAIAASGPALVRATAPAASAPQTVAASALVVEAAASPVPVPVPVPVAVAVAAAAPVVAPVAVPAAVAVASPVPAPVAAAVPAAAAEAAPAAIPVSFPAPSPVSLPAAALASAPAHLRLELSNGNGVPGAVARLKPWLTAEGLAVERLTNQRPYVQRLTVIQYRTGQQDAAQRVAAVLRATAPAQVETRPTAGLRPDVRVVLGRDWARAVPCFERDACARPATVAAWAPR